MVYRTLFKFWFILSMYKMILLMKVVNLIIDDLYENVIVKYDIFRECVFCIFFYFLFLMMVWLMRSN